MSDTTWIISLCIIGWLVCSVPVYMIHRGAGSHDGEDMTLVWTVAKRRQALALSALGPLFAGLVLMTMTAMLVAITIDLVATPIANWLKRTGDEPANW